jgi:hypothetical protein
VSVNDVFPMGGYYNDYSTSANKWDKGCLVGLSQYLEQGSVFNAFNQSLRYNNEANTTVLASQIATLHCPSDPESANRPLLSGTLDVARTNYLANAGPWNSPPLGLLPSDPNYQAMKSNALGLIYLYGNTTIAGITDGTSNTLLFGEAVYGRLAATDKSGCRWWMAGNYGDTIMNAMYPPNPGNKNSDIDIYNNRATAFDIYRVAASSNHPGGVNAAIADGSVRFIKNTIDSWSLDSANIYAPTGVVYNVVSPPFGTFTVKPGAKLGVYQALSTRAGGERLGADSY